MLRVPCIAATVALVLAPLAANAQVAVKRLPSAQNGIIVQGGREAIGPKQDDPRAGDCGNGVGASGGSQGSLDIHRPGGENDPKARAGQGALAIGPKQDDPSSRGIIVQGGLEAIGPKQNDPRALAAAHQRPNDDNDPKGRCAQPALKTTR